MLLYRKHSGCKPPILSSRIISSNQKDYIFSVVNKTLPILSMLFKPWMHAASATWMYTEFAPTITNHRRQSYPKNSNAKSFHFVSAHWQYVCKPWVRLPHMSCSNTVCDCTNTLNIEMPGIVSNQNGWLKNRNAVYIHYMCLILKKTAYITE